MSSSPNGGDKRKAPWLPMTEYKKSKAGPRTEGIRRIWLGGWDDDQAPGPYIHCNINGTSNPINRKNPFLSTVDLDLTPTAMYKFYDFGYNHMKQCHVTRTASPKHAQQIAKMLATRCSDLNTMELLDNGKWNRTEGLVIWNSTIEELAFVGLDMFEDRIKKLFPQCQIVRHSVPLFWADHQPCLVLKGADNQMIEDSTDTIMEMTEKFGFTVNFSKNDITHEE